MRKGKLLKSIAAFLAANFLFQVIFPATAFALTAGPSAPEFSSFTPVTTTDMVNTFTGDFNYNLPAIEIPGTDGGGYALSLSYQSGVSSEEEASWVGFGWNLNPGSINRNTRGIPDDYNNTPVKYYNKTRPNWTASATKTAGLEFFSNDQPAIGLNASESTRFNNYQGFFTSTGFGITLKGMVGLNMNTDPNGVTFSANVNPGRIISKIVDKSKKETDNDATAKVDKTNNSEPSKVKKFLKQKADKAVNRLKQSSVRISGSAYGLFSYSDAVRATTVQEYKGIAVNYTFLSGQVNAYLPVGLQGQFMGNFNMQYNVPDKTHNTYGYMNTPSSAGKHVTDYNVEKSDPFSKRDYFIGIPFNNADVFSVSGEGLGGGFRFYPHQIGQFYPNEIKSDVTSFQMGFEVMIGQNVGLGLDFGLGKQINEAKAWNQGGTFSGGIFRFNNDMGGAIEYGSSDALTTGYVSNVGLPVPGLKDINLSATSGYTLNDTSRSSYIAYHTFSNVGNGFGNNFDTPLGSADPSTIAEVSVHNEDGNRYIYGKPVFVRNETSLQTNVDGKNARENYISYAQLPLSKSGDDYTVSQVDLKQDQYMTLMGEIKNKPYASTFLLTQITTPDYIDINQNGPDNSDFGGWTKFSYRKAYGDNNWYRYRTPYTGLLYQQNQISDRYDDIGSVLTGEKEVQYLDYIETKTHIAYFVTNNSTSSNPLLVGSGKKRLDGLGAAKVNNNDPSASSPGLKSADELEYLEKIVLFAKARMDKPIKVVRFEYDYSLVQNLPNNLNGDFPSSRNDFDSPYNYGKVGRPSGSGKLTLRKVWFEYEGTVLSRVSPYEFQYDYKPSSQFDKAVTDIYGSLLSRYDSLSGIAQNPDYSPYLLDAWGNNQPYGVERHRHGVPGRYQSALPAVTGTYGWKKDISANQPFDPAAWQLKQIKLPSGGEIHIQYEQKDYQWVQDKPVMGLASVIPGNYNDDISVLQAGGAVKYNPYYIIEPEDLGADAYNYTEVTKLKDKINAYFHTNNTGAAEEKVYFKFLYAIQGNSPGLKDLNSEYITGWANLNSASVETLSGGKYGIKVKLESESSSDGKRAFVPKQACIDFYNNHRQGLYGGDGPFMNLETDIRQAANDGKIGLSDFRSIVSQATNLMAGRIGDYKVDNNKLFTQYHACLEMKEENSYIKLPLLNSKKGGGARVKALLMYDSGIEKGDAALYGSEYSYELEDGSSSGVATNEPSSAREENPLVVFLPRKGQSMFNRLIAGQDKDQTEGPIGESMLPSPTIGHSRVLVKNIHSGKTGTGFTISEFYTAKDFPFRSEFTSLDKNNESDLMNIPAGLINYKTSKAWAAQGFRFLSNNMHGQPKKASTYGGVYDPSDRTKYYLTSAQETEYYKPGESISVMKRNTNGSIYFANELPGKEMDITMESKKIQDITADLSIEVDISITISYVPPIFVTVSPSFDMSEMEINTHATSKVINYPTIVKRVTSFKDGAYHVTENLAFSDHTGHALITKSYDSFDGVKLGSNGNGRELDGSIYNVTIPAAYKYPEMGPKSNNVANTNQLNATTGQFVTYSTNGNPMTGTWFNNPKGVISASVQTFAKGWATSWNDLEINNDFENVNAFAPQLSEVWRAKASYIYKAANVESSNKGGKIYEGGTFIINKPFDWINESNNQVSGTGWLRTSNITKYSPHGSALEEVDALGLYSAVRFGYNERLVTMQAKNAHYGNIWFNDFENGNYNNASAHSGEQSLLLSASGSEVSADSLIAPAGVMVSNELRNGGLVKFWAKQVNDFNTINLKVQVGSKVISMEKVASSGEWSLYSARIPYSAFTGARSNISLLYDDSFYIDDIRVQPYDAQGVCYVYDISTLRPIVQFDDQHFGLFYQYNAEGKLVRKLIETEKGIKTIQETQYNSPRVQQ